MENVFILQLGWLYLQDHLEHWFRFDWRDMAIILEQSSSFVDNLRQMGFVMPCHCGISAAFDR